jgi:rRNA pseudouridine-1189 N-methylase Emg1 (Nep1/Mra1 family)
MLITDRRERGRDRGVPEDVLDKALDYRAMAKPHDDERR